MAVSIRTEKQLKTMIREMILQEASGRPSVWKFSGKTYAITVPTKDLEAVGVEGIDDGADVWVKNVSRFAKSTGVKILYVAHSHPYDNFRGEIPNIIAFLKKGLKYSDSDIKNTYPELMGGK